MADIQKTSPLLWGLLAGVILLRLLTLGLYPLTDNTEARYAEIARVMLATGNWLTPQLEVGVPFWAKPPLYAWLTAGSFKLFGINEFAARLPHFLCGLASLALVWQLAASFLNRKIGQLSLLVLASTLVFFVASGAVMTDMVLLLCTTLSMSAFWFAIKHDSTAWSFVFFAGLGLGLLAKGPIAVVLIALPLLLWAIEYRQFSALAKLRWLSGIALILVIALPWYLLAESQTPGFLNYFIVGEHFMRFLQPGWEGDLYGTAHDRPVGTILVYWLLATLPWTPFFAAGFIALIRRRQFITFFGQSDAGRFNGYLLSWVIAPLLFFAMAGNILPTYVLPGIPAFALLLAAMSDQQSSRRLNVAGVLGLIAPAAVVAVIVLNNTMQLPVRTEKNLVTQYQTLRSANHEPLYYLNGKPLSAAFYSNGQARQLDDIGQLQLRQARSWIAVRPGEVFNNGSMLDKCEPVSTGASRRFRLLRCDESGGSHSNDIAVTRP